MSNKLFPGRTYRVRDVEWSASYGGPGCQTAHIWSDNSDGETQNVFYVEIEKLFRQHRTIRHNIALYGAAHHSSENTLRKQYLTALREAPEMQFMRDLLAEYNLEIANV